MFKYDIANIEKLLESFYKLTRIRLVMFDANFNKVAEYPSRDCEFCTLIKSDASAAAKCRESDRYTLSECSKSGKLYFHECHTGLAEIATPIHYGNIIIGYLMFGQVQRHKDKEKHWQEVKARCQDYDIDNSALKNAYLMRRYLNSEQILAASQILEACAGYLWLKRYVSLRENTLVQSIDDYLNSHLDSDLSVTALCEHFHIGRSKLYSIIKEVYGKGIEQLTRELRVTKAKELLLSTDMAVSNVAAAVGFGDYNYFIKVFKKEVGTTPARFKKAK